MESYQMMQIGFYVCLAVAVLFFIVSVLLFFRFDIRTILSVKSGKRNEKAVKELTEENRATGRMYRRNKTAVKNQSGGKRNAVRKKDAVRTPDAAVENYTRRTVPDVNRLDPSVFNSPTVRLDAVDSAALVQSATIPEVEDVRFDIVRNTVLHATDEIIE